jgi:hypothetical protein
MGVADLTSVAAENSALEKKKIAQNRNITRTIVGKS